MIENTSIALPGSLSAKFEGCDGSYRREQAAVKRQTELDLRTGAAQSVGVLIRSPLFITGKSPAAATGRQQGQCGVGSLRIADSGYFNRPMFAAIMATAEYFLSRLQFGTGV